MKLLRCCSTGGICAVSVFLLLWFTCNSVWLYCRRICTGSPGKLSLFPVSVVLLMLCSAVEVKNIIRKLHTEVLQNNVNRVNWTKKTSTTLKSRCNFFDHHVTCHLWFYAPFFCSKMVFVLWTSKVLWAGTLRFILKDSEEMKYCGMECFCRFCDVGVA
jgi:hypothetical protein